MEFTPQGNNAWLFQKMYYNDPEFEWEKKDSDNAVKFFTTRLATLKKTARINVAAPFDDGLTKITLLTTYPGLVTGVGVPHETGSKGELKLGFEFDYTTGMPVIRGHSVKGKLRSAFPQYHRPPIKFQHQKAYLIHCLIENTEPTEEGFKAFEKDKQAQLHIGAIEEEIFDGKLNGKPLSVYRRDVFFDAYITQASQYSSTRGQYLGSDAITPHPDPLKNPVPLPFLKVLPGVQFEFRFKLNSNGLLSAEKKKSLFEKLLLEGGMGAKTNVGYGQFKPITV
jgi:CRISPR-associated protein Cmr6